MKKSREELKEKFVTGAKPQEKDYHDAMDSYVHKDELAEAVEAMDLRGEPGEDAHQPMRGTYVLVNGVVEGAPTEGVEVGDTINVVDRSEDPATMTQYRWDGTAWVDTGVEVSVGEARFKDGTEVGLVEIVDDLERGGHNNVPSAEAVKGLNARLYGSDVEVTGNELTGPWNETPKKQYSPAILMRGTDTIGDSTLVVRQNSITTAAKCFYLPGSQLRAIRQAMDTPALRIVTNASNDSYCFFLTAALPNENLTFANLEERGLLTSGTTSSSFRIPLPHGTTVDVPIPDDAVYFYVVYKWYDSSSSRSPRSVISVGTQHSPGHIDTLLGRQVPEVVDSLDSDSATAALSAKQGKRLAELTLQLVEPVNLLDPDTVKAGYYVRKDNGLEGTGLSSSICRGCTGFFEIPTEGICCDNVMTEVGANGIAAVVYNEAKERVGQVSADSSYRVAIDPTGHNTWKYVRFNVRPGNTGVYRGTSAPAYTPWFAPYLTMKDGTVADGSVTLDKLAFTRTMVGKNKLDPASILPGKAVRYTDGRLVNASGYGATGFIPVSRLGLVANHTPTTIGSVSMGYAVYADRDVSTYIRGVAANGPTAVYSYRDSDEGGYVRFTVSTAWSQLQVEEGAEVTAYEPYQTTKVIDPSVLPSAESQDGQHYYYADGVEVILPPEILVTQGDSLQLFYRPMVKAVNPYAFDILAICSSGKFYPRYLQLDTAYKNNDGVLEYLSTGTRTLTVSASVSSSVKVAEASTRIRIIPLPSSPAEQVNILLVGASRIEGGDITKELRRRLVGTDGIDLTLTTLNNRTRFANPKGLGLTNVNFVGRQSNDGARQDGKSGRQISYLTNIPEPIYTFHFTPGGQVLNQGDTYGQGDLLFKVEGSNAEAGDLECTLLSGSGSVAASGTLTLVTGSGTGTISYNSVEATSSNDFYDPLNTRISFAYYSGLYCGGVDINIFILHLCDNDIFNQPNTSIIINNVKTLMRAYHGDYPDGKFILYSSCLPDVNGGLGVSYSGNADNAYWHKAKQYWAYNKALNALAADPEFAPYAILATTFVEFDAENLYFSNSLPTSNRSAATERLGFNGLHFGAAGQKTIADTLFHAVCHALNLINNPTQAV